MTSVQHVLANAGYDVHWSVAQQVARVVVAAALQSGEHVTRAKAAKRAAKYQRDAERWTVVGGRQRRTRSVPVPGPTGSSRSGP